MRLNNAVGFPSSEAYIHLKIYHKTSKFSQIQ